MWMMTDRGFFSIVDKGDREGYVCIRARVRGDLDRLCELEPMKGYVGSIEESDLGDYRCRAYVTREDWIMAAALLAEKIDYPNFKNAVRDRQTPGRARLYGEVWGTLLELQRR